MASHDETCSVCMENLMEETAEGFVARARVPCFHVFHRDCLAGWIETSRRTGRLASGRVTCPVCRIEFGENEMLVDDSGPAPPPPPRSAAAEAAAAVPPPNNALSSSSPSDGNGDNCCCICMEDLASGVDGRRSSRSRIPCFHVFHRACLDRWVDTQRGNSRGATRTAAAAETPCPVCRINFRGDRDVVVEGEEDEEEEEEEGRDGSQSNGGNDREGERDALLAHALQRELELEEEEERRAERERRDREEEAMSARRRQEATAAASAAAASLRTRELERGKAQRARAVEQEKARLRVLQRMAEDLRRDIRNREAEHDRAAQRIAPRQVNLLGALTLPLFGDSSDIMTRVHRREMKQCENRIRDCRTHLRRAEEEADAVARNLRALESPPPP